MKYFLPDSLDLVDPSFDFHKETRSETRVRQRDDCYAHEIFSEPPYSGILVSKGIVDGIQGGDSGRYSLAQRHRLLRNGVRQFLRLDETPSGHLIETMGDCGAFSYVRESRPPYSVEEVIDFYTQCGFDRAMSVDHVILDFKPEIDQAFPGFDGVPAEWRERQKITLDLAEKFLAVHEATSCNFTPYGVAQAWSPKSFAYAVEKLQEMGYRYIALGGLVPLKTQDIISSLECIQEVRRPETCLHLLGVTRCEHMELFKKYGVGSFDSTSPLRKAFKDDKDNYFTPDRNYSAIRVPQVEANVKLKKKIVAGHTDQELAKRLERQCIDALLAYDREQTDLETVLAVLTEYEALYDGKRNYAAAYRQTLADRPWKECPCEICRDLGIHVVMFRGAERNRRRGFHNVYVFYHELMRNEQLANETCAVARGEDTTR